MGRARQRESLVRSVPARGASRLVAAVLLLLALPPAAGALVCGDGILDPSEECDPNCGTPGSPLGCPLHPNGDPTLGTCTSGTTCFREFTCCKFNCQFVGTAVPCADGNDCTVNDVCNMVGQCIPGTFTAPGTACGSATITQCDLADTCNGMGTCISNNVAAGTTADVQCTDGNDCTFNECNGTGGCQNPSRPNGTACGDPTTTQCNLADTCTGGSCAQNQVAAGTTADVQCTDGNDCTFNQCNGVGGCQNPSMANGTGCGDSTTTQCNLADTCSAGSCATNNVAAGTTADVLCADGNDCTFNQCNGMGACQNPAIPNGSECRPLAGPCDTAEQCAAGLCPPDGKVAPGTECRGTTDICDPAEACDGVASSCPGDLKLPDGTPCRVAAGVCDLAEQCNTGVCPPDAKSTDICNPSLGPCDPAESCDGVADTCPADTGFEDGTACDDGNDCTIAGTCASQICVPTGPAFVVTGRALVFRDSTVNVSMLLDNDTGYLAFFRNVTMANGTTLTANRVRLGPGTTAFDVVANFLDGPGTITGTYTPSFTPAGAGSLCTAPPVLCGGPDVTVDVSGPLAPGSYGNVRIMPEVAVTLSAGTYDMCSLRVLPGASVLVGAGEASPTVRVTGILRASRFVTVAPGAGAGRPRFQVGLKAVFGSDGVINAHLEVAGGKLALGRRIVFDGTMCTRKALTFKEVALSCTP